MSSPSYVWFLLLDEADPAFWKLQRYMARRLATQRTPKNALRIIDTSKWESGFATPSVASIDLPTLVR